MGSKDNVSQHTRAPSQRCLLFGVGCCEGPSSLHCIPTVAAAVGHCYCCFWYCCYYHYMLTLSSLQLPPDMSSEAQSRKSIASFFFQPSSLHLCLPLAEPTRSRLTECLGNAAFIISAPLLHISTHNMLGMRP